MNVLRVMDAFCASCDDVQPHAVRADDPSSCFCERCGTCQVLVQPLAPRRSMTRRAARQRADVRFRMRGPQWQPADLAGGIALLAEALQEHCQHGDDLEGLPHVCNLLSSNARALQQRLRGQDLDFVHPGAAMPTMPPPRPPRDLAVFATGAP